MNGILIIKGPNIKQARDIQANIIDLAPTILSILGLPVSDYMDGRVIDEVFIKKPDLKVESVPPQEIIRQIEITQDDQAEIERRLKTLGYL